MDPDPHLEYRSKIAITSDATKKHLKNMLSGDSTKVNSPVFLVVCQQTGGLQLF